MSESDFRDLRPTCGTCRFFVWRTHPKKGQLLYGNCTDESKKIFGDDLRIDTNKRGWNRCMAPAMVNSEANFCSNHETIEAFLERNKEFSP